MNKGIIAMLLMSLIFVIGCDQKKEMPELPPFPDEVPAQQQASREDQLSEIQKMSEAIKKQDFNMCEQLSESKIQSCKDRIHKVRAIQQKNIRLCNNIQSNQIQYECEKGVRSAG